MSRRLIGLQMLLCGCLKFSAGKKKKGHTDRVRVIQKLAERSDVDRIVNACDAGREGELIFREVVSYLGVEKPVERLWLQSMTTDAIRDGFAHLRPGRELEGLGQAAECRARADWLIGMNMSRLFTLLGRQAGYTGVLSVGRVQTPTLALLVERELEVLAHVPVAYWRVLASFEHGGNAYAGVWFDPRVWLRYARLVAGGERLRRLGSDTLQLGGDFVLDANGVVTYARAQRRDDRPPVSELLAELRRAAGVEP